MRKFIITLFAILYLGLSTEATVHLHFCMNKFVGWSLFSIENNHCGNCKMKKASCCKEEIKQVKIFGEQQKYDFQQSLNNALYAFELVLPYLYQKNSSTTTKHICFNDYSQPLLQNNKRQTLLCTFRI